MKTKAAIAYAAGQPLEVVTVDLDEPKTGEVLIEIKASGVCHTDEFTRSGADPEGLFPVIFGHEGAGVDVGPGVQSVRKGDHVIPLYTPECRECRSWIDPLITHTMPLDRINDAFKLMHSGESIRSVVTF